MSYIDDLTVELRVLLKNVCDQKTWRMGMVAAAVFACFVNVANGDQHEFEEFIDLDADVVAFPDIATPSLNYRSVLVQKGEWVLSVSRESDRQVLRAKSGEVSVSQTITPDALFKRFVFDLKKKRFEPMRQEIRVGNTTEKIVQEIKKLKGVTAVKRYENLGFSIVKVNAEVNPVEVLRTLRTAFDSTHVRILTGFFEYEPM